MVETMARTHTKRLIAAALSATLVAAGTPALLASPSAYADDTAATTAAANTATQLQDGTYTANVNFSCAFQMTARGTTYSHDMSSILPPNSKATITVKNGVATATVNFGTGSYVMNGTDTGAQVYLSDTYTPRGATEATTVKVGVATTQADFGSDAYQAATYEKDSNGAITSLSFPVSANTSTYYLQTAISGGGQMAFPYTTSQGNTFYPEITIDWSTLAAADNGNSATELTTGTYTVPTAFMNASNTTQASMAAPALDGNATVTVANNGTATVDVKLKPITRTYNGNTITAYSNKYKVYSAGLDSSTTDATVVKGTKDQPTEISFTLPPSAYKQGGVYLNLTVGAMGYSPDVFLQLDFANAKAVKTPAKAKAKNTLKVAKSKVTVKKGKSTTVKVTKAKGMVTVKSSKKKVATAKYNKKTGKVTIKGVKKGTAKVTVTAKGNAKYAKGTKTIKVTVKK